VRRALLLVALAAFTLLQGCSAVRVGYSNADTLLRWQANSYFDFHEDAAEDLDRRIAAFLGWHRAVALPQYAKIAEEAAGRLERGLARADVDWFYATLEAQAREGVRAGAAEAAPLLDRLEPAQLEHFAQRLREENRKFERENLRGGPGERRQRRLKRTIERLEDWFGALSEEQAALVRRYNDGAPMVNEMRDRDRRRLQAELVAMLRAREARKRLPDWAAAWDQHREPAYAAAFREWRAAYAGMIVAFDKTLSAEQRRAAVARMRGFAGDFEQLQRR